jgi:hypothetical protein
MAIFTLGLRLKFYSWPVKLSFLAMIGGNFGRIS